MKTLRDLLTGLPCQIQGPLDIGISDIVFDSRRVKEGALFIALRGVHADGHQFIPQALASGAAAILCENLPSQLSAATLITAPDLWHAMAHISARFWSFPSRDLLTVGITGTNGKTTVAYLTESILKAAGMNPGVLGTINYRFNGQAIPAPNTTPFSSELQRFMAHIAQGQGKACVMEVSSHALALKRVEEVDFDVAVFTNLAQDHLDFHQTIDAYGQAKMELFKMLNPQASKPYLRAAVVNAEDKWSSEIRRICRVPVMGYAVTGAADIMARHLVCDATGSRFTLEARGVSIPIHLPLLGAYNVANALAAAGVGLSQKIDVELIRQGLESVRGVPGRVERISSGQSFHVIVDFAHTEDALRQVLQTLRALPHRRMITVFGCGGDRDRTKRPLMGEVATRLSDEVILTSDNPRSEDPSRIALDVEVGIRRIRSDHYQIILDREAALAQAFKMAQPDDLVLIAGKGHENYQILKDKTIPFDDREVARRLLSSMASHS